MSRSRKKNPFTTIAVTQVGEMKAWKKMINRRIRRLKDDIFDKSYVRKMSEIWTSPSDGKTRSNDPKDLRK